MPQYIAHRTNTISELKAIPTSYGVEIDLRDGQHELILQHDPFSSGEAFEDYLKVYDHGLMILNIKSEGVEYKILELLEKYNIKNYFFLDSSFPMIMKLTKLGIKNIALRFSEVEPIELLEQMSGTVSWVWVDTFTKNPLTFEKFRRIKELGYRLCFVSPDLLGRAEDILIYRDELLKNKIELDAICCKDYNVKLWS